MTGAVIGVGRMGRRHIQVLRALGLDLAGVADPRPESLELARTEESVPERLLYQEPESLLREQRPELVIVATTADAHCELTCLAARSGARFVLCEKPMACSIALCDRM